jgi:crotonobetainyl-CoA:carnitine CoA-transferase CaiB-like acyl-CoA transferase
MLANLGANYLVSGKVPGRAGNAHQNIVPYQVFEVAPAADGSKDHLILAVGNDGQFAKFCQVAGRPEIATDARFAKNQDRVRNRGVLVPMLEEVMKTRRKSEWLPALEAAKVPCGAINNLAEVFADPQVRERGMVHQWEHPLAGPLPLVGSPLKLGARRSAPTPAAAAGRAHRAGAVRGAGMESGTHRGAARAGGDLMADFVLVHGAWHGGWCWRRVVDALHAQGHRAFAVTLTAWASAPISCRR